MEMQEVVTDNNENTAKPVASEKASSVAEAEAKAKTEVEENARIETESESEWILLECYKYDELIYWPNKSVNPKVFFVKLIISHLTFCERSCIAKGFFNRLPNL